MFHPFQLYVANILCLCFKRRLGVAHVAMCVGGWWIVACRNRLVLPLWFTCGRGWARQAWYCCGGAAIFHMRAHGCGSKRWHAMRAGAGVMWAGVGCSRGAPFGRTLPPEKDLARGIGSCVRRARVRELRPDRQCVPYVRALVVAPDVTGCYIFFLELFNINS